MCPRSACGSQRAAAAEASMSAREKPYPRKPSGAIWKRPCRSRAQIVRRVCEALEGTYGEGRLGNPRRPLDDLVYIIISNKTAPETAQRTYRAVRRRFKRWDDVLRSRSTALQRVLEPAGLSGVKSQQIRAALRRMKADFGRCTLAPIRRLGTEEAQEYLLSLPGVSEKVAKCVMMYTMGAQVLPVDGHVHRIAMRLQWSARKRADQCHEELEALVPPHRRRMFHINCVMHGREVCRPAGPRCSDCCINTHCPRAETGHEDNS